MARVESVQLVDDLDGGVADETVSFSLEGSTFEIDLTAAHAAELRDALAPFVGAARRPTGGAVTAASAPRSAPVRSSATTRRQTAEIRQWALANGFELSERGRIPNAVVEAYDNRADDGAPAAEQDGSPAPEPVRTTAGPVDVSGMFKEASAG
ncbi:Lsr2 protein [Pseudonocardia sediminis]|uniref:Lsr2 protein n=1 Tax=Pseudonocardia sediminis TaxID=1397368 RepID=A0A4Q7V1H6_PSEST|nr:Lsr2 protein [Pseudonocardia sediminis]